MATQTPRVTFERQPDGYRHWRLRVDGEVAWLELDVDEHGGLRPGYELKLNSYDLGVDIELADAVQRLRFEHPGVRAVVLTSAKDRVFSAGANIRMLAESPHDWKVNFCKFTNETRCAMEDATAHSGQTYLAGVNGSCAGGGYELALACERILLIDDGASTVSLPEVALLGVLPGTGGLTRLTDKRGVRRDLVDVFATRPDGVRGPTAVQWRLVDEVVPRREWSAVLARRASEAAAAAAAGAAGRLRSGAAGIALPPLRCESGPDGLTYPHVRAAFDRHLGAVWITVRGPATTGGAGGGDGRGNATDPASAGIGVRAPDGPADVHRQGAGGWLLAVTRELDDAILRLRLAEPELGTWVVRTAGSPEAVLAHERAVLEHAADDWLCAEIVHYLKRTLWRLEVTSRSLIALVEPGGCAAGVLAELVLACDRQYMLDGPPPDDEGSEERASITLSAASFGPLPTAGGLTRLAARFYGDERAFGLVSGKGRSDAHCRSRALAARQALELGLVTAAPDELDWDEEIRLALEARASLSPDACTGLEANHRFPGQESMQTKIFGRLSAWQNWIFNRPGASGEDGALRRYGTGRRPVFDRKRV
jgi:benzoyl-CoA-dihydrodiol lyase